MLSIEQSQKILNKNGKHHSKKQAEEIRDFLYSISELLIVNQKSLSNEASRENSDSV